MGNESQCGTNKSHENRFAVRNKQIARFAVHAICLFRTAIHFPWTEKKDTHSLRRVHAHPVQGTRSSRRVTNARDVKRYLQVATVAKDGLVTEKHRIVQYNFTNHWLYSKTELLSRKKCLPVYWHHYTSNWSTPLRINWSPCVKDILRSWHDRAIDELT